MADMVSAASTAFSSLQSIYKVYQWCVAIKESKDEIKLFQDEVENVAEKLQKMRAIRIGLRNAQAPPEQIEECLDTERKTWMTLKQIDEKVYKSLKAKKEWSLWATFSRLSAQERWVRRVKEEAQLHLPAIRLCYSVLKDEITKAEKHAEQMELSRQSSAETNQRFDQLEELILMHLPVRQRRSGTF